MFGRLSILTFLTVLTAALVHYFKPDLLPQLLSQYNLQTSSFDLPEGERLFTLEELKTYTGEEKGPYLAVLGRVYDVTSGIQHYGPNGGYSQFAGKDATRSFVTGDFSPSGLTDDVSDFTHQQMLAINTWLEFYNKDYAYLGRLIGRYYDSEGRPTAEYQRAMDLIAKGKKESDKEAEERKRFPGCNSEWSDERGGRVWCSTRSGGVERDWTGVPRQHYAPGTGDTKCVCVHANDLENSELREYPGCESTSTSCALPK